MPVINKCTDCFEAMLPSCPKSITLKGSLQPNSYYKVKMTDKFGIVYSVVHHTDQHGNLIIDTNEYPKGLFTPYAGTMYVELYRCTLSHNGNGDKDITNDDVECDCDASGAKLCGKEYKCLLISFYIAYPEYSEDAIVECCNENEEA